MIGPEILRRADDHLLHGLLDGLGELVRGGAPSGGSAHCSDVLDGDTGHAVTIVWSGLARAVRGVDHVAEGNLDGGLPARPNLLASAASDGRSVAAGHPR